MRRNLIPRTMLSLLLAGLLAAAATGCKKKYSTESLRTTPPAESSALTTS